MLLEVFAIAVMIGILSLLILVHETGHYFVARFFGFQTPVFGFGLPFGPYWVIGNRWGTEFRLHACMLGGYVAIPELGDETSSQETFGTTLSPFRKFAVWKRALVAAAGVAMNILFAYLIMLAMFTTMGQPLQATVVQTLLRGNPIAARAGIKVGDVVKAVNGTSVDSPEDAVKMLTRFKQESVLIRLERHGRSMNLSMTTNMQGHVGMGLISSGGITYHKVKGSFPQVAWFALKRLWRLTTSMVDAIGQMFAGLLRLNGATSAESVGLQDLHGVLAVVKVGADIAQRDWSQLLIFTVMISMDLAILNLLPWPALDGGHLAFMVLETVRGKPISERTHGEITKWGFVSLLVLMAVVMVNDVSALFEGRLNYRPERREPPAHIAKPQ